MPTLLEQRKELLDSAQSIVNGAKAAAREHTDDERAKVDQLLADIKSIDTQIEKARHDEETQQELARLMGTEVKAAPESKGATKADPFNGAKSVGEAVVNFMQSKGLDLRNQSQQLDMPEVKANTDTHVTGGPGGFYEPWLTEFDMNNPVRPVRVDPIVADLITWSRTSAQAIKYIEYPASLLEGSAGMVLEGGTKPQVHIGTPITRLDALSEVAAWFKLTDDVLEDLPRMVDEINRELTDNFADVEAAQLLRGNGTAPNLKGILLRTGVQTLNYTAGNYQAMANAVLQASMNIKTVSGGTATGVVINPSDYFQIRMMTDANGQYFAGGPFGTNYGNNGLAWQLPIWGIPTVVSTTAEVGKPIVANWKAATAYRKGGLKIESTNSHVDDFTNDRVTIRWRTKLGLAVRRPSAFVVLNPGA